jgi:flagellar hook-associated protein 3 FlgL
MRISTSQVFLQGLRAIQEQQVKLGTVSNQLAKGSKILTPSDDPAASATIVGLNEDISRADQYDRNLRYASSRLDLQETAMDSAIDVMQRIRELAILGVNGTQTTDTRMDIAAEGRELLNQMVALANTSDANGEYIFGGFQSQTQPISHDGAGNFSYNGDQGQRTVLVSESRQVAISDSASDIFLTAPDDSTESTFTVMWQFITDLESNSPTTDILGDIDAVMTQLSSTRSDVGARQRSIDLQGQLNESTRIRAEQTRSVLQDVDFAEASSELSQYLTALQAAQQAFARIQNLSLFNVLG